MNKQRLIAAQYSAGLGRKTLKLPPVYGPWQKMNVSDVSNLRQSILVCVGFGERSDQPRECNENDPVWECPDNQAPIMVIKNWDVWWYHCASKTMLRSRDRVDIFTISLADTLANVVGQLGVPCEVSID